MNFLKNKKYAAKQRPELERVTPNYDIGLSEAQVNERISKGYINTPVVSPVKSIWQIITGNIFTYFNFIFFAIAVCLISVGSYNHLMFLPIIIANLTIGIIQELNSKKALDKLSLITAPQSTVIRDGKMLKIKSDELVIDDIAVLTSGNQICADGFVVYGEVQVNESLVTGESDEITKRIGDNLLSGSFIISGKCHAIIENVGADSFISKLTLDAKKSDQRLRPGMMKSLTRLIQIIGIAIIPLGALLYIKQYYSLAMTITDSIESTAAALLGMIPEGLYLLTSVALAVSVMRLAKKKTLVHDLKCIETLARVDVLCVDKTGTITDNHMNVDDIIPIGSGNYTKSAIKTILNDFTGNMSDDNATMKALKAHFQATQYKKAVKIISFSSATKYSGIAFSNDDVYVTGAPEFILRDTYSNYSQIIEQYSNKGYRVLLLAKYLGSLDGGALVNEVLPISLIILSNTIRPEAHATFKYFNEQNVNIKVISGDNPITASDAARRAGIPNYDQYIDATTLDTPEKIRDAVENATVFGRVTPEQKKQFIITLKKAGHTVAMTGDGVNDVPALKEADCGIAMASGSEIACQVAHLVLLDSNFASMPAVVAEGRRVINNIERTASLFLVKNIFSFLMTLISIFAGFPYPITPAQLSIVSTTTIGIPAFFLALQPNENIVTGKFLRNVLVRAAPAALTDVFTVVGVLLFAYAFNISDDMSSTVSALTMAVVGIAMLYRICSPFNNLRRLIWGGVIVIFTVCAIFFAPLFTLSPLDLGSVLVLAVFGMLSYPVMNTIHTSLNKLSKWIKLKMKRGNSL